MMLELVLMIEYRHQRLRWHQRIPNMVPLPIPNKFLQQSPLSKHKPLFHHGSSRVLQIVNSQLNQYNKPMPLRMPRRLTARPLLRARHATSP